MLVAVLPDGRLQDLRADGRPVGAPHPAPDLPAAIAAREAAEQPRWIWAATADTYPALLRAGVRVARCHDLELTEALLLGHAGRWGEPRGLAAATARLRGLPVPADRPRPEAEPPGFAQGALFATFPTAVAVSAEDLIAVYADQQRRLAQTGHPGRFRMLAAAESAGSLIAAEMGHTGLPWRADVHDRLLRELLGPPQPVGPPRRLAELTAAINEAFGTHGLHPDSPAEVVRAFARAGIQIPNTRRWVLRRVDHPAVAPLLEFKELYRIWTAHGWSWLDSWVHDGRFHPEYVAGGVVSGRWGARGGSALQIPKVVRRAVLADPGWRFVVADAGQLEPRVMAAVSGDRGLARAAAGGDLYAELARDSFDGDRAKAKIALIGAMYGQTGGDAIPALAVLRRHYPTAFEYVEQAARVGENGGLVRSWLGRTCPPAAGPGRDAGLDPPDEVAPPPGRARGRFTRNFVIQATAAEWALVLLATLRTALAGTPAELVLFVHDEVVVHCPADQAEQVAETIRECAARAGRMLFGASEVRFPLDVSVVGCYAEAK
ncbi:3'-5' exonuclease [Actinoplanes sp. SE50]|uniref:bifunctional 3'-5' exonuclease/DNA polymerase n=1 Tax=unclassified Actinoplanes TaxID=2626549 RepID=UPI00023ED59D|nr:MULTISPECIES: bifunctional 3'-5' exonuclease/DNA polymerase [unclassified Actinoplanes]AEV82843.1 DNA polymerase I [Actinoplanes sp. SE50/110]ATO81239.1 3'-5' exonuclease [Actinoplanes sp. SE50]SLL98646.1 bifunctional 3'-5' exonuclease/DNA polymerase [Actinoplanes sp. SE50/110]